MTADTRPDRPEPDLEVVRLAYEESRRALEHQSASLDELRGRTGSLLAMVGVGTAFLGGIALSDRSGPYGFATWIGIVGPVVAVGLISVILVPVRGWTFHHAPGWLLSRYYWGNDYEPPWPARIDQAYVWLTEDMDGWRKTNRTQIRRLYVFYRLALIAGVASVAAWIVDLTKTPASTP